jgi:hypothetical protein
LAIALTALLISSCGSNTGPAFHAVKGSAFFEGKPATGAVLSFHKVGEDNRANLPHAKVQPDGTFTLSSHGSGDGAPIGKYQVTVIWKKKKPGGSDEDGEWVLPPRYLAAATSGLEVDITSGVNELPAFQLTK